MHIRKTLAAFSIFTSLGFVAFKLGKINLVGIQKNGYLEQLSSIQVTTLFIAFCVLYGAIIMSITSMTLVWHGERSPAGKFTSLLFVGFILSAMIFSLSLGDQPFLWASRVTTALNIGFVLFSFSWGLAAWWLFPNNNKTLQAIDTPS